MDFHSGVLDSIKYIVGLICSAVLSFFAWSYKNRAAKLESLDKRVDELHTSSKVTQTELGSIKDDIHEIKQDLKKLLFR